MISRDDFKKIDHHWIASMNGNLLSVESHAGVFKLYIYGALAELPKPEDNLTDPTDREWIEFVRVANEVAAIPRIGERQEGL